jgi:cation diffusion facilitator CzcD-associated flavoprotein CzcO
VNIGGSVPPIVAVTPDTTDPIPEPQLILGRRTVNMSNHPSPTVSEPVDVLVIGAGFAGIYAMIRARRTGRTVRGVEAADGVGGVWYWNRYPGARCDVESADYSYSFDAELQREWQWSERYATQPEILRYAEYVADRFGLTDSIDFGRRVDSAVFDDRAHIWDVTTARGDRYTARYVMFATGSLSAPNLPDIPGFATFGGEVHLTARWPADATLTGKRVGVIGTGSSGVQSIPIIADQAARLTVFQRTANYTVPVLNKHFTDTDRAELARGYAQRRAASWRSAAGSPHTAYPKDYWEIDDAERRAAFEARWAEGGVLFGKTFDGQTTDPGINAAARAFAEEKIRSVVRDRRTAADLTPEGYPIGTKRICTDNGYYDTFNREHVTLVNLRREPIVEVVPDGIRTPTALYHLDTIVLATGFDALTGALTRIRIVGKGGAEFAQRWAEGPVTFLGLAVPEFPNLFTVNGPGSPAAFSNHVMSAEQQVDWLLELLDHCDAEGCEQVEATGPAALAWTDHVDETAARTLFPQANSWYNGANVDGKARRFMPYVGGFDTFIDKCAEVRSTAYAGFEFTR